MTTAAGGYNENTIFSTKKSRKENNIIYEKKHEKHKKYWGTMAQCWKLAKQLTQRMNIMLLVQHKEKCDWKFTTQRTIAPST